MSKPIPKQTFFLIWRASRFKFETYERMPSSKYNGIMKYKNGFKSRRVSIKKNICKSKDL